MINECCKVSSGLQGSKNWENSSISKPQEEGTCECATTNQQGGLEELKFFKPLKNPFKAYCKLHLESSQWDLLN